MRDQRTWSINWASLTITITWSVKLPGCHHSKIQTHEPGLISIKMCFFIALSAEFSKNFTADLQQRTNHITMNLNFLPITIPQIEAGTMPNRSSQARVQPTIIPNWSVKTAGTPLLITLFNVIHSRRTDSIGQNTTGRFVCKARAGTGSSSTVI